SDEGGDDRASPGLGAVESLSHERTIYLSKCLLPLAILGLYTALPRDRGHGSDGPGQILLSRTSSLDAHVLGHGGFPHVGSARREHSRDAHPSRLPLDRLVFGREALPE